MKTSVHLVLHPHGIAPTVLKLDSWSPGLGFIPILSTKGINQIKKGNCKKKNEFYAFKKIYYIFKTMGAIPCGCNSTSTEKFFYICIIMKVLVSSNRFFNFLNWRKYYSKQRNYILQKLSPFLWIRLCTIIMIDYILY